MLNIIVILIWSSLLASACNYLFFWGNRMLNFDSDFPGLKIFLDKIRKFYKIFGSTGARTLKFLRYVNKIIEQILTILSFFAWRVHLKTISLCGSACNDLCGDLNLKQEFSIEINAYLEEILVSVRCLFRKRVYVLYN